MNSVYLDNNLNAFLAKLDINAAAVLLRSGLSLHEANKSGDPEWIRLIRATLLDQMKKAEQIAGVQLLQSPDGSYICATNAFALRMDKLSNHVYTKTFASLEEANAWLMPKRNLILMNVSIKTRTTLGLLANHTVAAQIVIQYKYNYGKEKFCYGIWEQEKTKLFLRGKTDHYAQQWEAKHPGLECVFLQHASNARGNAASLMVGFGNYAEHQKFFVTYRERVNAA